MVRLDPASRPSQETTSQLSAFLLAQEAARHTPKTLAFYNHTLSSFVRYLQSQSIRSDSDIGPTHIRSYLLALERRGLKAATVRCHAVAVKAWLNWLVREGDLIESPMRRVSMPKQERLILPALTVDEVQKLLATCDRTPIGLRDRAILMALLDSGLRASEFCSIRVGDLDMRTGLIKVHGKGHKERYVCLGTKTRLAILRYLRSRGETRQFEPLWVGFDLQGQTGIGLSYEGVRQILRRKARLTGVSCTAHMFRRTFATWALRQHMDVFSLQRLMGHADVTTTQRYLDQSVHYLAEAHRQFGPVDNLL